MNDPGYSKVCIMIPTTLPGNEGPQKVRVHLKNSKKQKRILRPPTVDMLVNIGDFWDWKNTRIELGSPRIQVAGNEIF